MLQIGRLASGIALLQIRARLQLRLAPVLGRQEAVFAVFQFHRADQIEVTRTIFCQLKPLPAPLACSPDCLGSFADLYECNPATSAWPAVENTPLVQDQSRIAPYSNGQAPPITQPEPGLAPIVHGPRGRVIPVGLKHLQTAGEHFPSVACRFAGAHCACGSWKVALYGRR